MSTVREIKEFQGVSPDAAYEAADQAFRETGFEVWKRRPLAWLFMAKLDDEDGTIQGNAACRPANGATITITLDSENHEESVLAGLVNSILNNIETALDD